MFLAGFPEPPVPKPTPLPVPGAPPKDQTKPPSVLGALPGENFEL
jgi:hypothetical protein